MLNNQQSECDLAGLFPCSHAEADSLIILHLMHAVSQGHSDTYVRTVDNDVVMLAIAFFDQLRLSTLWIGLGTGKHYRDSPVHGIKSAMGSTRSLALPLFHSLSGCDTISQLLGIGKNCLVYLTTYAWADRDFTESQAQPTHIQYGLRWHETAWTLYCAHVLQELQCYICGWS